MVLMLGVGLYNTSSARGYGYYHGYYGGPRVYCGPRVYVGPPAYYGPRVYGPVGYYHPAYIPGHWGVNRYGTRVWVGPRR